MCAILLVVEVIYSYHTHLPSALLVGLGIFRALTIECRRDIALITLPLMVALNKTLTSLPKDLEVAARVASAVRDLSFSIPFVAITQNSLPLGLRTLMVML